MSCTHKNSPPAKGEYAEGGRGLIPRLRFPEFRDAGEWGEKAIGAVCQTYSGGTPSSTNKKYYGGKIPFIRSAEIDKPCTELFLTEEGLKESSAKIVKKGDVLFALYGANSGEVAIAKLDGAINQAILCLKSKFSNKFIYQFLYFNKSWIIDKYIQGGQGNLSGAIVKSINVPFPPESEQQKIADCLSSLDELISAHSDKLDAIKTHKKGLMQQLFPRVGETVPRLRFPEFRDAGEWELKKLGDKDVSTFVKKRISVNNLVLDSYVSTENILPDFGGIKAATKLPPSGSFTSYKTGDILIANIRPYLRKVWVTDRNGAASNDVIVVRPTEGVKKSFLPSLLKNDFFIDYVMKGAKGVKMPRGDVSLMKEYSLAVPGPEEQQKITDCLSSLDELIAAHSDKLAALKAHKKGLMQQLFPAADEVDA